MSTLEGVSPTTDTNSTTSNEFIMVDTEQSDGTPTPTTTTTATATATTPSSTLCSHCNALNPSSSQTCIKCGNSFISHTTTPQQSPTDNTSIPPPNNINPTNETITSYEPRTDRNTVYEETPKEPELDHRYTQFDPNNMNAYHLSVPIEQIYPNEEELFGNFFIRTLYLSISLLFVTILSFNLWFSKTSNSTFQAAFDLSAIGALFIFLASIFSIIYIVIDRKYKEFKYLNILQYISIILYIIGAFLYWIGGCVLTAAWNNTLNTVPHIHAFSGIWFCEITYISAHAIIAAMDLKKRYLNIHGLRLVLMSLTLLCLSLVIFFCVTIWSVSMNNKIAGYDLEATGYFIIILLIPLFIVIKIFVTPTNKTQLMVDLVIAICLILCILFIMLGYFVLAGNGDIGEMGTYWVGFGFFLLFHGIFIVIDMSFQRFLPCTQRIGNDNSNNLQQYMLVKNTGSF